MKWGGPKWLISVAFLGAGGFLFGGLTTDRVAGQEPPAPTGAAFLTHWVAEVNAGDIDGALALARDDVALVGGPPCNVNPCIGKESVRARLQVAVNNRTHYTLTSVGVHGSIAKARAEQTNNAVRACGLRRFIADIEVEMRGRLIARLSFLNDRADAETAAFEACVAAGGATAPAPVVRAPATGDAGLVME